MTDVDPESREMGKSLRPLKSLAFFIAPYKLILLMAIAALLISSAAMLAMPVAVRNVIDYGFSAEDAASVDRYFLILLLFALVLLKILLGSKSNKTEIQIFFILSLIFSFKNAPPPKAIIKF